VEDSKLYKSDNITQVTNPKKGNETVAMPSGIIPNSKIHLDRLPTTPLPQFSIITDHAHHKKINKYSSALREGHTHCDKVNKL